MALLKVGVTSGAARPPGGDQTGAEREDVKGAVLQPEVRNLASGVRLDVPCFVVSPDVLCRVGLGKSPGRAAE